VPSGSDTHAAEVQGGEDTTTGGESTTTGDVEDIPPEWWNDEAICPGHELVNPGAQAMGTQCTQDSDCQWGICYRGSITDFQPGFGVCTKACDCGEGSSCAAEGNLPGYNQPAFVCQRPSKVSQPEGKQDLLDTFCAAQCYALEDCKVHGDFYNTCARPETGTPAKLCQVR
jgi:hypothetical protein